MRKAGEFIHLRHDVEDFDAFDGAADQTFAVDELFRLDQLLDAGLGCLGVKMVQQSS